MENHEKEEELVNRVENSLGPAQKLVALRELTQLYKLEISGSSNIKEKDTARIKERYLEAMHRCLEISNADPSLWYEFGEICFSLNLVPLALYAFSSASALSPTPLHLYSYALCLARTHDYVNALALSNYLIDTYQHPEAHKIQEYVHFRLGGKKCENELFSKEWSKKDDINKIGQKKIWNLYSLCVTVRHLANNKDGDLYVFERGETGAVKKKKSEKYVVPECKYWEIIEKYKVKVMEMMDCLCFGFITPKIFSKSFNTSKMTALFEPELKQFISSPVNYRKLAFELISFLCKNSPRPSPLLSGEVTLEIIRIFALCRDFLSLNDEYLTLLEIAIKESPDMILELRNSLIQTYKSNPDLNYRCYAVLAFSYFKSRDSYEKQPDALIQQLYNAEVYAEKALQEIGENCIYMWWCDSFLNAKELSTLRFDIKIDYECIQIEKELKNAARNAGNALSLLERLTKILAHSHKNDDPQFYWKKIKLVLKNINKFQFRPEEHETFARCMTRYVAVLLYNLEDGIKLTNDHDIKGLFQILTDNINYSIISKETKTQLIVSSINLLRHCSKYFNCIPFWFKKMFKDIDPAYLPNVFTDFHSILNAIHKHSDTEFHLSLCKAFEKSCFINNSPNQSIIYKWLYGLGSKKCSCKATFPSNPLSLPNSSNKLSRLLSYLHVDWKKHEELGGDPQILSFLQELYSKEPKFFVSCKLYEVRKLEDMLGVTEFHSGCCSESAREIAKRGYQRFTVELIANSLKADIKECMKNLKTASDVMIQALSLDPKDYGSWGMLGTVYMWRWILGYFDLLQTFDQQQATPEHHHLSLQFFESSYKSTDSDLRTYIADQSAFLIFLCAQADKNCLRNMISQLSYFDSPKVSVVSALLKHKNKENIDYNILKDIDPLYYKLQYAATGDSEYLERLTNSEDALSRYYSFKIIGNWAELLDTNFLSMKIVENDMELYRPGFVWKLRRKAGEKCLDVLKMEKNVEKIQGVILKFSGMCGRTKKNKEVVRVINKGVKALCELGSKEIAMEEIDKSMLLNTKEKQILKAELKLEPDTL